MSKPRTFFELASKLDALAAVVCDETDARVALLLVMDDEGGTHFTVQGKRDLVVDVPAILIQMANSITEDLEREKAENKH